MSKLPHFILLCVTLLLVPPTAAKRSPIAAAVLEAKWQNYAASAAETAPAMQFPYAHCFQRAAAAHGLPETLLLAVARGESDFEPRARSHANAYGLMQILWPATAKHLGIHRLSELTEPCTNVDAGARYLKELLAHFGGNLHRALAAYNYGPSRIPVSGGRLPEGAVWYSSYIFRHLDYVLNGGRKKHPPSKPRFYADQGRLYIIRFDRPYRAAALVDSLQPDFGELRLDWFRRADKGFDVVMLYQDEKELERGKRLLTARGFQ
jgi:hypothetical protein